MNGERTAGGLRCREVLARLSDFIDGDLTADELDQVREHLADCTNCARFGDKFAKVIGCLRTTERDADPDFVKQLQARLHDRLRAAD